MYTVVVVVTVPGWRWERNLWWKQQLMYSRISATTTGTVWPLVSLSGVGTRKKGDRYKAVYSLAALMAIQLWLYLFLSLIGAWYYTLEHFMCTRLVSIGERNTNHSAREMNVNYSRTRSEQTHPLWYRALSGRVVGIVPHLSGPGVSHKYLLPLHTQLGMSVGC